MLELGLKSLLAYLLGSVAGALVLGQFCGFDIRAEGSGNAGATNALRTRGAPFAAAVLLIDLAKGWIGAALVPALGWPAPDPALPREWLAVACAAAVVLGHVWPVWYGFRGGKGAATVVGVVGAIEPRLLVPLLGSWLVVLLLTGFVSLATMLAGVALVIAVAVLEPANTPLIGFCAALAAFIIYTHRSNITRLRAGNENRARRLWLLRPRDR